MCAKYYIIEENLYNITGEHVEATRVEKAKCLHSAMNFMEEVKTSYSKRGFIIENDTEESGFFVNYKDGCTYSHIRVKAVIEAYL